MNYRKSHWDRKRSAAAHAATPTAPVRLTNNNPGRVESQRERGSEDRLMTSDEAAEYVRLSRRTLERYRVTGGGPNYVKLGPGMRARVVYREADLRAWLDGAVFNSSSEYDHR